MQEEADGSGLSEVVDELHKQLFKLHETEAEMIRMLDGTDQPRLRAMPTLIHPTDFTKVGAGIETNVNVVSKG